MPTGDPHMSDDVRHAKKIREMMTQRANIGVSDEGMASILIPTDIPELPSDSSDKEVVREATTQTCMVTDIALTDTDPNISNSQMLIPSSTDAQMKMPRPLVI